MENVYTSDRALLFTGDSSAEPLPLADACVSALVCDPPSGRGFMSAKWDMDKGGKEQWIAWATKAFAEAHRTMIPGAYGLIWAMPRQTFWTGEAIDRAGFEILDIVHHIYGEGFPKNHDLSAAIDNEKGLVRPVVGKKKNTHDGIERDPTAYGSPAGTASFGSWGLSKSAHECMETAPVSAEATKWAGWGTALKPAVEHWYLVRKGKDQKTLASNLVVNGVGGINIEASRVPPGRFPANLVHDGQVEFQNSLFFYAAKPGKKERNTGCTSSPNNHPTVKSVALMDYLVRLVTPPDGLVLDIFCGSGTTGVSAVRNGFDFVGVDANEAYVRIAAERVAHAERELGKSGDSR